jgi:transporter family protein
MPQWIGYAIAAAVFYALHQVFTKLAAARISDGLGALVVETTAAATIALYLAALFVAGEWNQKATAPGVFHSVMTGICVGIGTVLFVLLFQRGAPLSALPAVLALGAALLALAGIAFFGDDASPSRLVGIFLSIVALYLLRAPQTP